jgi:peptidoglycan/LPS O-acetylase OafA/YrhL
VAVVWFFSSRSQNTFLSTGYIFQVTVSSCILSYLLAIPLYVLVERPFKNFLELILFPKSSIFKKSKDVNDGEESSDSDESEESDHETTSPF